MSINAKKRENRSFEKQVGIFNTKVLAINPTNDELIKIYGSGRDEEPEYFGEKEVKLNEEGDTAFVMGLRVVAVLQDVRTKSILNAQFYLEDRDRTNKDGTKTQYINTKGSTTWAKNEDELPSWFLKGGVSARVAKVGEEELYNFLSKWSNWDFSDADFNVQLDWEKLMLGDVSEIKDLVVPNEKDTIVGMATIRVKEVDGEEKTYQGVYTKNFMPGYAMKVFNTKKFTPESIELYRELQQARKEDSSIPKLKYYEQFLVEITDPEYGIKDFYKIAPLADYDPAENFVASGEVHDEDGPDYQ